MHNSFYASGFLYSPKTHQILLLKSTKKNSLSDLWSMLGGESREGEEAQATFQRIIHKWLNISLKVKDIYPVYDYFHTIRNKISYVFYAEVGRVKEFDTSGRGILSWFSFNETLKLQFTTQTKQDVVVGGRVIDAKWRETRAIKDNSINV